MDIFQTLHPSDPPVVTSRMPHVDPASPAWEAIIREQCDADRHRACRASWAHSLTDLATRPIDGRIPEEVAL